MRCLNCLTVAMDTDKVCKSCGAPLNSPSYRRQEMAKPFFAVIFMIAGSVGYNLYAPPAEAVKSRRGINSQHVLGAALVGAVCAMMGGAIDYLLNRQS